MAERERQVVALGGGGFLMEPDNPALDLYVLRQARAPRPTVAFLATASGDADAFLAKFYTAVSRYECRPSHLPLFQRTPALRDYLLRQDVIYVGGGNTKSMLAVWRDWGLPGLLREAWQVRADTTLARNQRAIRPDPTRVDSRSPIKDKENRPGIARN